jgi:hypothetical protein
MNQIKSYIANNPLRSVLIIALLARLLAVFFAKGFMMHDDHFLTVEPSASWAAGFNFNNWMPGIGNDNTAPEPISFFYLGFLFLIFKGLHLLGIDNPEVQMHFMRGIHALYSLLTIVLAYRITEMLSNKKNAFQVGLLLALIGMLPNFAVRNLVEMVCMPPLLAGFYWIIKKSDYANTGRVDALPFKWLVISAFVMGLAVGVRYQTGLLVALTGVMLWRLGAFKNVIVFGAVSFAAFFLTQIDDVLLWGGKPFQHLFGYFGYNTKNAFNYPGSPFAYLSFVGYFILPPVSLFLVFGFFKQWKKHLLIVLPITGFLLFHIVYPNKQERFILPALPFIVSLGVIGWNEFVARSNFWANRVGLLKASWIFFWTVNTAMMLVLCFTYSKKSRVESMEYLYQQGDCINFIQEATSSQGGSQIPQYYSGCWSSYYSFGPSINVEQAVLDFPGNEAKYLGTVHPKPVPNYILFYHDENLEARVSRMKIIYPTLEFKTKIEVGWFDELLHGLNPINTKEEIFIYKIS